MGDPQRQMEDMGAISAMRIGSANQIKSVRPSVTGPLHNLVVIMMFFKGDDGQGRVVDRVCIGNVEL